ncbi:UDP-forming cellulose synthase catalytic subunit [Croceibacterium mercuriale]|nr:UDP-forming cellulose synthase catalytic subunit [Croceibacterium mercuriale]
MPRSRAARGIVWVAVAAMAVLVVGVPLALGDQWTFAFLTIAGAVWLASRRTRSALLTLGILSLIVSTRYIFWRTTQTLSFDSPLETLLGLGLYAAELYAWIILVLGLLQTAWPLERGNVALQGEPESWPLVDVYVPTYNESLAIVRTTVFAALDMDYPPERFRVYILDDGKRPEFQNFAREVGCGYLTRADNHHAKAGNLNTALRKTSGELIAIFDCDHVPTRAFLQLSVGWFQKDRQLSLLQTPHHMYSPDPVQRNLRSVKDQPGEGDLFYGPIQKGNDLWNAAFFCGSCAIIRRAALADVGGFAFETVTEDAHTALKLQRRGWNTAYLDTRLSAGLATERLVLHIGQRIRWARGMTQIMRIDNPLLGPGLSWQQRLCYLNAMLHFQFPLPRIVFLTSPLAYLLFGANIIQASASMIFAYALPHLYCSMVAGSLTHGPDRRPFWSEIYETLIAFHLVRPTVVTWFQPRKGKFNVTDKGETLDQSFFDRQAVRPHLLCIGLIVLGVGWGAVKLVFYPHLFDIQGDTFALNAAWATFSLLILIAAVSVAYEVRQARRFVRIPADLPCTIHFANGHILDGRTEEISMGGLTALLPKDILVDTSTWAATHVSMPMAHETLTLPVQPVSLKNGTVRVRFPRLDLRQERQLVRAVMGRADAWTRTTPRRQVPALTAFKDILVIAFVTIGRLLGFNRAERRAEAVAIRVQEEENRKLEQELGGRQGALRGAGRPGLADVEPVVRTRGRTLPAAAGAIALLLAGLLLLPGQGGAARAQAATQPVAGAPAAGAGAGTSRRVLTLRDLRIQRPIRLEGTRGEIGIPFGMRQDEVVTGARMVLSFASSPAMLADLSQLVVLLNDEVVQVIPLTAAEAAGRVVTIPVNPALFLAGDNRLNLRLVGHYTRDCEDPFHSTLWTNVSNVRSWLDLDVQRLRLPPDLARLPRPLFDPDQTQTLVLPFVFGGAPDAPMLEAAAAIAGWMGAEASYRGFDFPPMVGQLPRGDAVVFLRAGQSLPGITLPVSGAQARIITNPADPFGQLLVVSGNSNRELKLAAAAIASGRVAFRGPDAQLNGARIPAYPAYGAPRWLRTDRPVALGELVAANSLQGMGLRPGALSVQFRAAPDLFFWPRDGGQLDLDYRYPQADWMDKRGSRMDVSLNGQFQRSLPLARASWWEPLFGNSAASSLTSDARITLPRYDLYGQNELVFDYNMVLANRQECSGTLPENVRTAVLPTSTIDLTDAYHALRMPNLASFANAGYPFTIHPDLARTAVVLGRAPTAETIRAFLVLMGRFGDATGAPATRVRVVADGSEAQLRGLDVIVLGGTRLAENNPLFANAPVSGSGGRLSVVQGSPVARAFDGYTPFSDQQGKAAEFVATLDGFQGIVGFQSPYNGARSVVAILADDPALLPLLVQNMADLQINAQIGGDLSVFNGEGMSSYAVGPGYWSGSLPLWVRIAYWFSQYPLLLAAGGLLIASLVAGPLLVVLRRRAARRLQGDEA